MLKLIVYNNIVKYADRSIYKMTGYAVHEVTGTNILNFFKRIRLPDIYQKKLKLLGSVRGYLFTASLQVKEVLIQLKYCSDKKAVITFHEITKDQIEKRIAVIHDLIKKSHKRVGVFSSDHYILLSANQAYFDLFEEPYNRLEIGLGKEIKNMLPEWDGSPLKKAFDYIKVKHELYNQKNIHFVTRKLEDRFCEHTIIPIAFDGKVKYLISIVNDVTNIVQNQLKIKKQLLRIQKQQQILNNEFSSCQKQVDLLNLSSDAMLIWELDGGIVFWNSGARRMYGYSGQEATGKISHELLETIFPAEFTLEKLAQKKTWSGQLLHTTKNGKKLIVESKMRLFLDYNGKQMVLESNRDITEWKKFESVLKNKNKQRDVLFQNITDALLMFDPKGRCLDRNEKAELIFTLSGRINSVDDCFAGVLYCDPDGMPIKIEDNPIRRAFGGDVFKNYHMEIRHPEQIFYVQINCTPVFDDNKISVIIITAQDVTNIVESNRKISEHQEKLLQVMMEKNKALKEAIQFKDDFLSTVSHELKTPLTVMLSALQLMELYVREQEYQKMQVHMKSIKRNAYRQIRLINNLLDITRFRNNALKLNQGNYDVVFLTKSLVDSVKDYADLKEIAISFQSDIPSLTVEIDEEKYERVLLNLLSNAIKFSFPNQSVRVTLFLKNANIILKVKDEGIGIPEEKQQLIFERFGQVDSYCSRKNEGIGIGLNVTKSIVEVMGGSISVDSEVNKGSTFQVILPARKTRYSQSDNKPAENNKIGKSIEIEFSDLYF